MKVSVLRGLHDSLVWQDRSLLESIDSESKKKRNRLESFFSEKRDFHTYRKALLQTEIPCVPYLGLFLTDINSVANAEWDKPSGDMIDFKKRTALAELIENFERFQSEYKFDYIQSVQV